MNTRRAKLPCSEFQSPSQAGNVPFLHLAVAIVCVEAQGMQFSL